MADNNVWQKISNAWPLILAGMGVVGHLRGNEGAVKAEEVAEAVKKAYDKYGLRTFNDERILWKALELLKQEPGYEDADLLLQRAFEFLFREGETSLEVKILGWWFSNEFRKYLTDNWYVGRTETKITHVAGGTTVKYDGSAKDLGYQVEFLRWMVDTIRSRRDQDNNINEHAGFIYLKRMMTARGIPCVPDKHLVFTLGEILRKAPDAYNSSVNYSVEKAGDLLSWVNQKDHELEERKRKRLRTRGGRFWNRFFKIF